MVGVIKIWCLDERVDQDNDYNHQYNHGKGLIKTAVFILDAEEQFHGIGPLEASS